jgi:enoyl-CoA hydratase/carnithine racemase
MADEVLCTVADHVATVTLNRPDQRNAMNTPLLAALRACFDQLERRTDVRVVLVRGAGPAFCAGMDLKEMEARRGEADPEGGVVRTLQQIERARHPTIALVHGDALAGGLELALHCDLRVAAETARLGMPLARIGLIAPFPLAAKIVETVGPAFARQILLTGAPVDGRRALDMGLVQQVAPAAEVEAAAHALARQIAGNAPLSLRGMKTAVLRAASLPAQIAHADIDALVHRARTSADASEGRRAMLEKRRPVFRGE